MYIVRFEVFTVVNIQVEVFWVVMMRSNVVGNQQFENLAASIFRHCVMLW
jgi:hypothetical protein